MLTVKKHEAKTHLSRLVEKAAKGEPFIIAKGGKPMVKVVPLDTPEKKLQKRIGALEGMYKIPKNFKDMFRQEIEDMFYGAKK